MKHAVFILLTGGACLFGCAIEPEQRLLYGISQDPVSLDPTATTDLIYPQIAFNIFETLIRFDSDSNRFAPVLATSWEMKEQGLCWRFFLRPGIIFHDGSPLNASAVKISFERQFDDRSRFCRSGATDLHGRSSFRMIKEIRIVNDLTIEFVLQYPYSAFLYTVASPILAAIVSPTALEKYGEEFARNPVGTGPWRFVQWEKGQRVALNKFKQYWGNPPALEEITYHVIPLLEKRIEALLDGRLDVISSLSATKANQLQHEPRIHVVAQNLLSVTFLGFHCQRPPFNKSKIRKAVAASLDIPSLVAFISYGFAEPAYGSLPKMTFGYDKTLVQTSYDFLATHLLASMDHGVKNEILELHYFIQTDSLRDHPLAHAFKEKLQDFGLQVKLVPHLDWEKYRERVLSAGDGHLFWDGWVGYSPHADSFLYPMFHSQSPHNFFQYKNSEVDSLLEQARRTPDEATQRMLYRRTQEIILQDVPAVFFSHPKAVYAIRDRVKNFRVDPLAIPWLNEVRLEEEK